MNKRSYSIKEVDEMGFPVLNYDFPADRGEFNGTLVLKRWNKDLVLSCYFDTDQGKNLKLCVRFNYNDTRTYRPKNSDLNVSEIPLGSRVHVTFEPSEAGRSTVWLTATALERYISSTGVNQQNSAKLLSETRKENKNYQHIGGTNRE